MSLVGNVAPKQALLWFMPFLGAVNISEFRRSVPEWLLQPFTQFIGDFIYPVMLSGVILLLFGSSKSVITVLAGIFVTFAVYGITEPILNNPTISSFFSIIAAIGVAGLMLKIITKPTGEQ